jgi:hypothetical protein
MKKLTPALFIVGLGYAAPGFASLVWHKAEAFKANFGDSEVASTAQFYCDTLRAENSSDWRVPTVAELKQMVGSLGGVYWSSTPAESKSHEALIVDFDNRIERSDSILADHSVICVRDS